MISFTSDAFKDGETIPVKYTQEGANVSPPLRWSGLGDDVKEIALICEDPDAPGPDPFIHWIIYDMDPQRTSEMPEGLGPQEELSHPIHARQGRNSAGGIGFTGPMPPIGDDWHRYRFKFYALNHRLDLKGGSNSDDFYASIAGHVIAEAEVVGKYQRIKRLHEHEPFKKTKASKEKRTDLR